MKLLSHLSRITTPGREYIPQIDGLRFIALFGVIAFHVWAIGTFHLGRAGDTSNLVAKSLHEGSKGVQLFFIVSGFILALPFARHYLSGTKKIRLRDYFTRRITRMEPPYIIQLVIVFFYAALVLKHSPVHQQLYGTESWLAYTAPHLLASLGYAHQLVFQTYPHPNIVLWSLEIEVQFYILAPFLATLFAIPNRLVRRATIVLLILAWAKIVALTGLAPLASHLGILGSLPWFLFGFLLVEIYLAGGLQRKHWLWDLVFSACFPAAILCANETWPPYLLPWILLLICVGAFCGRLASWLLSRPWLTVIGGMCYTIYMYHWLMIAVFIRGTIGLKTGIFWLDLLVQFFVLSVLIVLTCTLPFALFERPFMRKDWPVKFGQTLRRISFRKPV